MNTTDPGDSARNTSPLFAGGLRFFEAVLGSANDAVVVTEAVKMDAPGPRIVYVNDAFCRMTGYERGEVLGRSPRFLQGIGTSRGTLDEIRASLEEWRPIKRELVNYRKDGTEFWVELDIAPVSNENGRIEYWVSIQRDVTARKHAGRELRELTARHSLEMVAVLEPDGTLRYESPAIERNLGYSHEEMVDLEWSDIVHPEDVERLKRAVESCLATPGESPPVEYRARRADGSWRDFESVGRNLVDHPDVRGIVIATRDITDRRSVERELVEERHLLRTLIDSARDFVFVKDTHHRFLLNNRAHLAALGFESPEDALGKTNAEVWGEGRAAPHHVDDRQVIESGESIEDREEYIKLASGEERWISTTKVPLRGSSGEIEGLVAISRDITDKVLATESLREREDLLEAVTQGAPLVLFALDSEGAFTFSAGKGLESLGLEPQEVIGRKFSDVFRNFPHVMEYNRRALAGEDVSAIVRLGQLAFDTRYSPVRAQDGTVEGVIGVATEITEMWRLQRELEYRAFHDPLTDLPNRVLFLDRLSHALTRVSRRTVRESRSVAVLFMDIDNFKMVNDSLGHEVGDSLLVAVAERVKGCIRPQDTIARFGGDEIAVALEDTSETEAVLVAERISGVFREPFIFGEAGYEARVTFSIGIAVGRSFGQSPEDLLREADIAMYQAKTRGRACYEVYDQRDGARARERLDLENEIRKAVETGEFRVHFQPIVRLKTGSIFCFEALLRWEHPERGLLLPADFLDAAEETDAILPIGRWVLRESCRLVKGWHDANPQAPPVALSVNLSAKQLAYESLVRDVGEALEESGFPPSLLELEITESSAMVDVETTLSTLERLKSWGVTIAMDDFGTGYSSLGYLKLLPVDTLKIDRIIVEELAEGSKDAAIVSAVLALASALGQRVVAEGIARKSQLELLKDLGCELGQGNYFWKAAPPERALELYLEHGAPRDE